MKRRHYKLDGRTPVPCDDFIEWAKWFEDSDKERHVAFDQVNGCEVSTIFIGHDRSPGTRVLFETMVFPAASRCALYQERYDTWEEAEAGHARAVAWASAYKEAE